MAELVRQPAPEVDIRLLDAYRSLLSDQSLDPAMVALMLSLPSELYLAEIAQVVDVDAIHHARNRVERKIAIGLYEILLNTYQRLHTDEPFSISAAAIAKRSLKNCVLHYLVVSSREQAIDLCIQQFKHATNMTDEMSALTALVHSPRQALHAKQQSCLNEFYQKWSHEALVVNQWFSVQCSRPATDTLDHVKELMLHPAFDPKNPNKLRAVIGAFAMRNPIGFHHGNGAGYQFLADQILKLNKSNPQMAARLLTPLTQWRRYDEKRQTLMKVQLQRIKTEEALSKDVYEVVVKSLGAG